LIDPLKECRNLRVTKALETSPSSGFADRHANCIQSEGTDLTFKPQTGDTLMELLATQILVVAAAGYSLLYLLLGGGLGGAILIFFVAKMLGK